MIAPEIDVLVLGSGIAGVTAALEADRAGLRVTLVTKAALGDSNTARAQGGVAVAMSAEDSVASHVADTLAAGAGLSDEQAARTVCGDGPEAIEAVMARGVAFDRDAAGKLSYGLEAAHTRPRILHAGGDATGARISAALQARLHASGVTVLEHSMATDLLVDRGSCFGARLLDGTVIEARAVVLATGGAGQLYPHTTNPEVATADGVALALRAGAVVADLELVQFHPTTLVSADSFLISEAVRGEGAVLLDESGRRFMPQVHPDAELAPRDVVAREIARRAREQRGVPVRLDATAMAATLAERFPTIDAAVRRRGFDWTTEPVPVTPAAHYTMGGVRSDSWGRTSIPGLYAVGEVACTGLHGANRLASNSLLEGAVLGTRAVQAIRHDPVAEPRDSSWDAPSVLAPGHPGLHGAREFTRADLQQLMWDAAGLERDAAGLRDAAAELASWASPVVSDVKSAEDANLLLVARAVVQSAALREESRGAHRRTDFPDTTSQARHSAIVCGDGSGGTR